MNDGSTIAPHILLLSVLFSIAWGPHVWDTIEDWVRIHQHGTRRKLEQPEAFRSMVAAICLESICLAYVVRTILVLIGLGEDIAGQIVFFAMLGVNIPGAISVVLSRRLD